MTPKAMDAVFQALAHADRRRLLDIVRASPGCSVNDASRHFSTSRIAVHKHLRLLEEAGLLTSEKVGRTRRLYVNPVPIQMIHDRWVSGYVQFWAEQMLDTKYAVESPGNAAPDSASLHAPPPKKGKQHGTHD